MPLRHLRLTQTETFNFDEDEVRSALGNPPLGTAWEDFVLEQFELHNGSQYGDRLFGSCADADHGLELLPEGWDQ